MSYVKTMYAVLFLLGFFLLSSVEALSVTEIKSVNDSDIDPSYNIIQNLTNNSSKEPEIFPQDISIEDGSSFDNVSNAHNATVSLEKDDLIFKKLKRKAPPKWLTQNYGNKVIARPSFVIPLPKECIQGKPCQQSKLNHPTDQSRKKKWKSNRNRRPSKRPHKRPSKRPHKRPTRRPHKKPKSSTIIRKYEHTKITHTQDGSRPPKPPIPQESTSQPRPILPRYDDDDSENTGCVIPRNLKHSHLTCTKYQQKTICNQRCVFGYAVMQKTERQQECHKSTWSPSRTFSDCKPFVDCTIEVKAGGEKNCSYNHFDLGPQCYIACSGPKKVHGRWHTCNSYGKWNPPLPHCAKAGTGQDLVARPYVIRHYGRDYPPPHYHPPQKCDTSDEDCDQLAEEYDYYDGEYELYPRKRHHRHHHHHNHHHNHRHQDDYSENDDHRLRGGGDGGNLVHTEDGTPNNHEVCQCTCKPSKSTQKIDHRDDEYDVYDEESEKSEEQGGNDEELEEYVEITLKNSKESEEYDDESEEYDDESEQYDEEPDEYDETLEENDELDTPDKESEEYDDEPSEESMEFDEHEEKSDENYDYQYNEAVIPKPTPRTTIYGKAFVIKKDKVG